MLFVYIAYQLLMYINTLISLSSRASPMALWKRNCLQCMRHRRHGFDPWVGKIPWRRKWQPTPAFLPEKPHGRRRLAGYSLWGHIESDMTEWLNRETASVLGFPGGTSNTECLPVQEAYEMWDWSVVSKIPWRKAWQPTPIFLPRGSHGEDPSGVYSVVLHRVWHDRSNLAHMHSLSSIWNICISLSYYKWCLIE